MSTPKHDIVDLELCKVSQRSWTEADYTVFGRAEYWYRVRKQSPPHINIQVHQLIRKAHREYESRGKTSPWVPGVYSRTIGSDTVACPWHDSKIELTNEVINQVLKSVSIPVQEPVAVVIESPTANILDDVPVVDDTPSADVIDVPMCIVCGKPRGKGGARGMCKTHYLAALRQSKKKG